MVGLVDVGGNLSVDETKGSSKTSSSNKSSKSSSGRDSTGSSAGQSGGGSSGSNNSNSNTTSNVGLPSLDARAKFGSNIFYLSGTELGHVMSVIELECPTALNNWGKGSVEINVDEIPPKIFTSLNSYVSSKVGGNHHHHKNNNNLPESPEDDMMRSRKKRKSS